MSREIAGRLNDIYHIINQLSTMSVQKRIILISFCSVHNIFYYTHIAAHNNIKYWQIL